MFGCQNIDCKIHPTAACMYMKLCFSLVCNRRIGESLAKEGIASSREGMSRHVSDRILLSVGNLFLYRIKENVCTICSPAQDGRTWSENRARSGVC